MQRTLTRVLLVLLGVVTAATGLWPLLSPMGFYQDFPGFRHGWVSMEGAFDEHLIRDFGALNLALAATLIGAAVIGTTAVARLAGVAALLFAVPHFVYHLGHAGHFETIDRVMILTSLALTVAVPLVVLLTPSRREIRSATP
ncbi:hypothetical protein VSH64_46435 [Amycolatopsis rhabdoformis]|uniref:DUF4345 domain-containing protein n=1 Tax=Amycolatopsis rhabdoformis TaxID=1448059 RepID=A0ABZ1I8E3_9PSEU|nr:hypothetical protein [Amycolatopsis rhabdoformis]WSE30153.1 hypothetical protein VSH64_46435 [Amycolatopsis rhabdoformis]